MYVFHYSLYPGRRRRSDHLPSYLSCLPPHLPGCSCSCSYFWVRRTSFGLHSSGRRRRGPLNRRVLSRSPIELLLRGHLGREAPQSMVAKALVGGSEVWAKAVIFSNGFHSKPLGSAYRMKARDLSAVTTQQKSASGAGGRGARKALPWVAAYDGRGGKAAQKQAAAAARTGGGSWEESADSYFSRAGGRSGAGHLEERTGKAERVVSSDRRRSSTTEERRVDQEVNQEEDAEPVDDPRWNRIKSKFVGEEARYERPEVVRWSRQEEWGRKTWRQATESSVPKMAGEGLYGVGPVLAALAARRREFYSLYVQEGLDPGGNNKKKKDKKGVERILRMAEEIGLTVKEASKHDLNMVVDNRPHQGLVLDASPLEMVGIRELDAVSTREGGKAPVWVALDEVMDPQNLGAILRSAYYFGVGGVVLCAKNSAPLSGVVSKASAGSLEMIELRSCKNMMQFLAASVENGWRVLGGSVSSKAVPLSEVEAGGVPTVLVLGSEGTGLRPLVERSCSQLVRIPGGIPVDMNVGGGGGGDEEEGGEVGERCLAQGFKSLLAVESLNVSVAAGVLLYHLVGNASLELAEAAA